MLLPEQHDLEQENLQPIIESIFHNVLRLRDFAHSMLERASPDSLIVLIIVSLFR